MNRTLFTLILVFGGIICSAQDTITVDAYERNEDNVFYQGSLFTGIAIDKAENGQIIAEERYKEGKPHGLWKEWYSSGAKKFEGSFFNGANDGVWTQWYENGEVQRKLEFDKGHLIQK